MASKKIKKKGPAGAAKKAAGGLADAIGQIKRLDPKKTSPGKKSLAGSRNSSIGSNL